MQRAVLLILFFALWALACDQDPFGLSKRHVVGDYSLERWEDGTTHLRDSEREYNDFEDLGPIGGIVLQIGWTDDYILAERQAHLGGNQDGWMVVDVHTKKVTGPFAYDEIVPDPRWSGIELHTASAAWSSLR